MLQLLTEMQKAAVIAQVTLAETNTYTALHKNLYAAQKLTESVGNASIKSVMNISYDIILKTKPSLFV